MPFFPHKYLLFHTIRIKKNPFHRPPYVIVICDRAIEGYSFKQPQEQHNDRTAQRDRQMEHSGRKWVLCCAPQSRWWVFLNMFLNTVSDFTTWPEFGLHPALHSLIQSTQMLFSQTVWLPFSPSVSLITFLASASTSLHSALHPSLSFYVFLSILTSLSHFPLPASSVMLFLLPLLLSLKWMKKKHYSEKWVSVCERKERKNTPTY